MKSLSGFRSRGLDHRLHELPLRDPPLRRGRGPRHLQRRRPDLPRRSGGAVRPRAGRPRLPRDRPRRLLGDAARLRAHGRRSGASSARSAASKAELLREALAIPGLYGPLAGDWNARDGEYQAGRSKLLHYTTLHTQPWRPFPAQLVYQENAHADLWHDLEREADAAGFEPFTRARPSARFVELGSPTRLEDAPDDDVPWLLDERFRAGPVRERIRCEPPGRGRDAALQRTGEWWTSRFEAASKRHPKVSWEIELLEPGRSGSWHRAGGPRSPRAAAQRLGARRRPPWQHHAVDRARRRARLAVPRSSGCSPACSRGCTTACSAPRAPGSTPARSSPLEPPWPELVIAAGRRTAPVALWIREQSAGRTRLVQLGRKGADFADLFDLAVTPGYCRLFPHPKRIETSATLHAVSRARLAEAAVRWKQRLEAAPAPRIALLVGGTSGQYQLDPAVARRLAQDVMRFAKDAGGSVFATTSRRLSPAAGGRAVRRARGRRLGAPLEAGRRRQPLSRLPRARGRDRDHGRQRVDARRGDGARPTGLRVSAPRAPVVPAAARAARARRRARARRCRRIGAARRGPSRDSSTSARG